MNDALLGIRGWLIDTPEPGKLRARRDGALIVKNGLIAEAGDFSELQAKPRDEEIRWLHADRLVAVFPGLIDVHAHVPQYPAVARGESELLPWLRRYIFPLEREFRGEKARRECARFFAELARNGTTTAMLYTAVFEESCEAAFEAAQACGARAIIGKMMMDIGTYGELPPEKIVATSLAESERLCKKWHGANGGLLDYAFSPRFAISCSREMMTGAAALAKQHDAYIQTHLAENLREIEQVKSQCHWGESYTDVYAKCGLLTERTVFGHCVYLSDAEREMLVSTRSCVAHCPTSNLFLGSGIMPLDHLLDDGLRIGLGSDVAAGPELNMWQVMRSAIEAQKARSFFEKNVRVPSAADALHLATLCGAEALGKSDRIGSLDVGKEADLTIMDYRTLLPYAEEAMNESELTAEDVLSLCIYRGGPHATAETFVRGRSVYRAPQREEAE